MKQIKVFTQKINSIEYFALVDDEDFEFLNRLNWYPRKAGKTVYANTHINGKSTGMHTLLLVSPNPIFEVDHKNQNGLDNQKNNLRLATRTQQRVNQSKQLNNTSGFKGVSYNKRKGMWRAYLNCKGVQRHLGYFYDKETAAKKYNEAAFENFGEFARLNELPKLVQG